jgi:D-aminoacyl-tRNA deacylase
MAFKRSGVRLSLPPPHERPQDHVLGLLIFSVRPQPRPMRAVIQRVLSASVTIAGQTHATIGAGLLVLVGVQSGDTPDEVAYISGKIARLRIFSDAAGKMNRSVVDSAGDILAVSQFTLFASTKSGNRPSFFAAAEPAQATALYELFVQQLSKEAGKTVLSGVFAADMQVALINDGPVTIIIDSRNRE